MALKSSPIINLVKNNPHALTYGYFPKSLNSIHPAVVLLLIYLTLT